MAKPSKVLIHGTYDGMLKDEPGILINSLTFSPTRQKKEFADELETVRRVEYANPKLGINLSGRVSGTPQDLADIHPGTLVTSLVNYSASVYGFDPGEGSLIAEDPTREMSRENAFMTTTVPLVLYPYVD